MLALGGSSRGVGAMPGFRALLLALLLGGGLSSRGVRATPAPLVRHVGCFRDAEPRLVAPLEHAGTQFTGFTSTKVQILICILATI